MFKQATLSIFFWTAGLTLLIVLFLAMLFFTVVLFPFDRKRKVVHAQCFWWAASVIALNPYWKVNVAGLENIDRRQTYVIVANHQSLADIIVVYKTRMQFKWVAKESLFKLPVLGWNLALAKHIRLRRGKFSSIKEVYYKAAEWLRGGVSVLFFPEGTRSKTGDMGEFQNGAFKLAIKEKVPVLPISIDGTVDAIPKGSWILTAKVNCNLKVFPPIDTAKFETKDFIRLRDIVHKDLIESLARA
jgi:1-acyl-sn-glycerol-3-phosphate acyltransferase